MKHIFIAILIFAVCPLAAQERHPVFMNLKTSGGQVFKTNDFVSGARSIPLYKTLSLKAGYNSTGNSWQDAAYGMPYYGVGLYMADFGRRNDLGRPVSVYLLQGARMAPLSRNLSLNYEWNLGASMGWKEYDAFDNPENVALGAGTNAHVGVGLYLDWRVSRLFDLHAGADLTHFSNGAQRMPNKGLNMYSIFVEASYNFGRRGDDRMADAPAPPDYTKHLVSDVYVTMSSRRIQVDTTGTNLPDIYIDHKFKVLGLNYSLMRAVNYRYRYGLGTDLTYDESAGSWAERVYNPRDGKEYDVVRYGTMRQRLSLGLTAKGEVALPGYSIFANLGWQVYRGNARGKRLYQIVGVKVYLHDQFFGTFGIRSNHFSKAQYLFWSLGYTIHHRR
jgi:hypothetical protein